MSGTRDPEVFANLYSNIYRELYKYAYYVLGNKEDAEDAVSSAVVDGYSSFDKLRNQEAFKSWMFAILAAKCKRTLKSYVNRSVELPESLESSSSDLEGIIDVRKAFMSLKDKERQIVAMSVIAGYNSGEIGLILHMNPVSVRSVVKRALDKMRKQVE